MYTGSVTGAGDSKFQIVLKFEIKFFYDFFIE
jgi:hypothetical protein